MNTKLISAFSFLLLFSCSVGPDYKRTDIFSDVDIATSLNLHPDEKRNNFAISDLDDEVLNILTEEALKSSPNIRIAVLKLKQAREVLKISDKGLLPMFDASAKYNYVNASKNMETLINSDYYQFGVDMSWEIDIFGGTRSKIESSKAQYRAMLANLKNVNVSLISDVATAYINLRMAEQNLKNMRENVALQEDAYNIISEKYTADLIDEMTLNQSRYLLENMKMQIPSLEYEREMYKNSLAVLLGRLPDDIDDILKSNNENLVNKILHYDVEKLYNLPIDIIRNRPDVKMAEEELISQNAEVGVAVANVYPKISLTGFFGFQSLKFSDLIEHDSVGHSLVPQLTQPLFHFFQLRDNIRLQKLKRDEALVNYEQTLLNATAELKNAITALKKEFERNNSATMAYQKMTEVSDLMWKKYLMGLVEYTDVLNSEQNRLSAQTNMINSNANLYKDIITFYKAIGGRYD
ncbi:MAG: efflux transporter outer membrane subunit [Alphaproteobacteria bacterium]